VAELCSAHRGLARRSGLEFNPVEFRGVTGKRHDGEVAVLRYAAAPLPHGLRRRYSYQLIRDTGEFHGLFEVVFTGNRACLPRREQRGSRTISW